jgi:DNA-binding response OmpR family regulator
MHADGVEGLDAVVIEDDRAVRELMICILELEGYRVRSAADGARGLRLVSEHMPDLVITDLQLPQANGCEVAKAVRMLPGGDSAVVIVVSGVEGEGEIERALLAGADDFLHKPFRPEDLTRRAAARVSRQLADAAARR